MYNKRWPFAYDMLWMIKVEADRQNKYIMPWRLLTPSDPCVLLHHGWGQPPSCVAKNTTPSIFNYRKTQAVAGEGVGAGVLVGRVDFEMQTTGSSPLQMSASVCSRPKPLLLRKSDAKVFWEDQSNFVTFQPPSTVYKQLKMTSRHGRIVIRCICKNRWQIGYEACHFLIFYHVNDRRN